MKNKIVIFIPSIEGGGVEKNLFLIANLITEGITKKVPKNAIREVIKIKFT